MGLSSIHMMAQQPPPPAACAVYGSEALSIGPHTDGTCGLVGDGGKDTTRSRAEGINQSESTAVSQVDEVTHQEISRLTAESNESILDK